MENPKKNGKEIRKANELGFQEMAAILSPLGLYGGNLKTKLPLRPKLGYTPTKGTLGNCLHNTMRRMPSDRKLAKPRRKPCDPNACPPLRSL
jgi:hypothetical protein